MLSAANPASATLSSLSRLNDVVMTRSPKRYTAVSMKFLDL